MFYYNNNSILKLFLVFCLFHIQLSLTVNDFKISLNSNTAWAEASDSKDGLSYSEDQSTDFNPAQGSKAENFAKSMLSIITMMVIGLVGINIMMNYASVAPDSKIFAIGAVTYFIGEIITTIHAVVQIIADKKETEEITDSQLGNLKSLRKQHSNNSIWLLAKASIQTAASVAFGIATGYSLKLYIEGLKRLGKVLGTLPAAIAEQTQVLVTCQANDPSAVCTEGCAPEAIGQPYYSLLCPQTIGGVLSYLKTLTKKIKDEIIDHNTPFDLDGSSASCERKRLSQVDGLELSSELNPSLVQPALQIIGTPSTPVAVTVFNRQKLEEEVKSFSSYVENIFDELFKSFNVQAGPAGINYLSQSAKSLAQADRAVATNQAMAAVELEANKNLYFTMAQSSLNVTKLEDKIAISIARGTQRFISAGLTRAAATRLAQKSVVQGVAKALARWIVPRVTVILASSAAASAIPGIGWIAGATNLAVGAYTIWSLWDAFSQTQYWRDIRDDLYLQLRRKGHGGIVDWLQSSIFYLPGALCYYYPSSTPLVIPPPKCDKLSFHYLPVENTLDEEMNIFKVDSIDEILMTQNNNNKVKTWQNTLLDLIVPTSKAQNQGVLAEMGVKAGIIAVMMIFREKLALLVDGFLCKPLGRSIVHGSITALTTLITAATWVDYKREVSNVDKLDQIIETMENKETDSTNTTSDPNTTSIQTWQNLLDRFLPKAIANESSSNMVMEIDRKFPCFNYRQGKCRSIEKEMKSVYPIHKNILNKKFYSLVKTTARIGDGLSNSHGISPKVASFMQQLNAQQPYITALNTKLEKKANQMQKKMNIRRINFEKQQKSFLEKVRQVALDSIKKAGAKLEDIVKFKPKSTIKPSKKIGDYGHESLEENITEIKSSGTQNSKVVNSIQNENNFNLKDVTVTKDKELSIFRIISRRYNLHFSQY